MNLTKFFPSDRSYGATIPRASERASGTREGASNLRQLLFSATVASVFFNFSYGSLYFSMFNDCHSSLIIVNFLQSESHDGWLNDVFTLLNRIYEDSLDSEALIRGWSGCFYRVDLIFLIVRKTQILIGRKPFSPGIYPIDGAAINCEYPEMVASIPKFTMWYT